MNFKYFLENMTPNKIQWLEQLYANQDTSTLMAVIDDMDDPLQPEFAEAFTNKNTSRLLQVLKREDKFINSNLKTAIITGSDNYRYAVNSKTIRFVQLKGWSDFKYYTMGGIFIKNGLVDTSDYILTDKQYEKQTKIEIKEIESEHLDQVRRIILYWFLTKITK